MHQSSGKCRSRARALAVILERGNARARRVMYFSCIFMRLKGINFCGVRANVNVNLCSSSSGSCTEPSVRKISTIFNFKQGETILNFSQRPLTAMCECHFAAQLCVLVYIVPLAESVPTLYRLFTRNTQVARREASSARQTEKENQSARKCIVPRISGHRKTKTKKEKKRKKEREKKNQLLPIERSPTTTTSATTITMQDTEMNVTKKRKEKKS